MFLQFAMQLVPSVSAVGLGTDRERESCIVASKVERERERSLLLQEMWSPLRPSVLPSFIHSFLLPPSAVIGLSPSSPSSAFLSYHF